MQSKSESESIFKRGIYMENKFYYKTPAVILMMLAGSSAVAHAAENETTVKQSPTPTDATTHTKTASTQNTLANQTKSTTTIPVTQTNKATDLQKSTATYTATSTATSEQTSNSLSITNSNSMTINQMTSSESSQSATKTNSLSTASTVESQSITQSNTVSNDVQPLSVNTNKIRTLQATQTVQKATTNMSVNDYIKYNNFKAAPIVEDFSSHIPKYGYRNGVGKPEGIVAHETANNTSTIWGEVQYMKNNYQNAFVHAFVDDNNIIETAPTDYLAWGAGPVANERFIHVELVRVQGKDRFARAINNYADYIATNLLYYNLPVDSAEYDGNGTLWSHKAVSNFLGGTDHSDPYGWFQMNGYSMDELAQLVTEKYNAKLNGIVTPAPTPAPTPVTGNTPAKTGTVSTSSTSKMAKINSSSAQVYSKVLDVTGNNAGTKANNTYFVNKQATLNNEIYYSLTDNNGIARGWVKAKDLTLATRSQETQLNTQYKIKSTVDGLFNTPWGTNYQKVSDLKANLNQNFKATKKLTVNNTTYYFGTVNNLSGWIQESYLASLVPSVTPVKTGTVKTSATSKMAKINSNNAQVYSKVLDVTGKNAGTKANNTYFVNKQATLNNEIYYSLTDNNGIARGWVKAKDLTLATRSQETKLNTQYQIKSTVNGLFNTPWGTNYQKVSDLKTKLNQNFKATKKLKVNNTTYYFGTVNNLSGWIQDKYLASLVPQVTNVKPVKLIGRTAKTDVLIYTDLQKGTKASTKPVDTQFYITEEATKSSTKYFKLQDIKNKVVGWINDNSIDQKTHQTVSWEKAQYIVTNPRDYVYSIPGGSKAQRIKKLSSIPTKIVNVIRTDKVGTSTWYKVLFDDNSVGYVSSKSVKKFILKQPIISKQKAPISLTQAINKQMQLINKTTNSGPKYAYINSNGKSVTRIATRDEVSKNINPSKLLNDAVQKYQFLNLNKSQGISGNILNKLLVGKGILENKGDAFATASKLLNINEIYLISHAILETGHGTSKLANGLGLNAAESKIIENAKTKYYNMFGTKATDNNALLGGTRYAKSQGWNTPEKAIIGGGKYVNDNYFKNNQVTLYQMRWNPSNPATHQYATDVEWANKNARLIANYYKTLGLEGLYFTVSEYL